MGITALEISSQNCHNVNCFKYLDTFLDIYLRGGELLSKQKKKVE